MLMQEPIYKPSSIFCFKPILLSAHKLTLLIYGDNKRLRLIEVIPNRINQKIALLFVSQTLAFSNPRLLSSLISTAFEDVLSGLPTSGQP